MLADPVEDRVELPQPRAELGRAAAAGRRRSAASPAGSSRRSSISGSRLTKKRRRSGDEVAERPRSVGPRSSQRGRAGRGPAAACRARTRSAAGTCAATRPGRSGRSARCRRTPRARAAIARERRVGVRGSARCSWSSRSVSALEHHAGVLARARAARRAARRGPRAGRRPPRTNPGRLPSASLRSWPRPRPPSAERSAARCGTPGACRGRALSRISSSSTVGCDRAIGQPAALRRAAARRCEPSRQLDVRLAQQRLLAQRRARVVVRSARSGARARSSAIVRLPAGSRRLARTLPTSTPADADVGLDRELRRLGERDLEPVALRLERDRAAEARATGTAAARSTTARTPPSRASRPRVGACFCISRPLPPQTSGSVSTPVSAEQDAREAVGPLASRLERARDRRARAAERDAGGCGPCASPVANTLADWCPSQAEVEQVALVAARDLSGPSRPRGL